MVMGGPALRPPGESYQRPPEPQDDEARRRVYAAHRSRRHVPFSSLVVLIVLVAIVAAIVLSLLLNLL